MPTANLSPSTLPSTCSSIDHRWQAFDAESGEPLESDDGDGSDDCSTDTGCGIVWGRHASSLLLVLLLAVSAQAALVVGQLVQGPSRIDAAGDGGIRQAARSFYHELDAAFQTGSVEPLAARLTGDFVDHGPGETAAAGSSELMHFVQLVHGSAADVRVRVTSMQVADDLVRANIAYDRISQPGRQWQAHETLLVRDGRIAERWPASFPFQMSEPLTQMEIPHLAWKTADVTLISLSTIPGNPTTALDVWGPAIVWIEAGSIETHHAGGVRERATAAAPIQLGPGELVSLAKPDEAFKGRLVLMRRTAPKPEMNSHGEAHSVANSSVDGALGSRMVGTSLVAGPFYATIESRVSGDLPSSRVAIAIDRVYLPADGEFALGSGNYPGIVFVERGSISLGTAAEVLRPGDAATLPAGAPGQGRAEPDEPAVVQTIRIE